MKKAALFWSFVFGLLSLVFFTPSVFAQTNTTLPPSTNVASDVPNNLHNWTQNVMIEVMSSLSCQLVGIDPTNSNQKCLGVDQKTGKIGFVENGGGAIGTMGYMISILYTPPATSVDYFQNLAHNFGIVKTSYAQTTGTGFEGLRPLLNLWTGFRNIVYLIFVIVFIAIGMAIMLRIKIDPRTVMTIQNQIPKIIIGIILVTFSYAIAGFLIDMMYVSIHVIGNIIISTDPNLNQNLPTQLARSTNPFQAAGNVGANGGNAAAGLWSLTFSPAKGIGEIIDSFLHNIPLGGLLGPLLGGIAGILAFIVIAVALLTSLFKLWIALLKAYIYLLIDITLSPFWIFGSLIPGSPLNFSGWVRSVISNLAAFPATIGMFLLGKVFMDVFKEGNFTSHFAPPFLGDRGSPDALGAIIGFALILVTPYVLDTIKSTLKAPKIETGFGKAIGAGVGTPQRLIGGGASTAFAPHYDKSGKLAYPGGTWGRFLRGFGFVR